MIFFSQNNENTFLLSCRKESNFSAPNSITTVEGNVFSWFSSLASIVIQNSATTIEGYSLHCCSSLVSITVQNNVTTIESFVFSGCSSLTTATLPKGVESQKCYIFNGCNKLKTIIGLNKTPFSFTKIKHFFLRRFVSHKSQQNLMRKWIKRIVTKRSHHFYSDHQT